MYQLLVIQSFHPAGLELLHSHPSLSVEVLDDLSDAALEAALPGADIITVRNRQLTPSLLDKAPRLRCVAKHGAGVDNIAVDYLSDRGIPVINTPGANALSVAEQVMALMLGVSKQLVLNDRAVRKGDYAIRDSYNTCCLSEKNVLLCGYGRIGRLVAQMCAGFSMKVFVYDPYLPADALSGTPITRRENLEDAVTDMDYVSLHMPLTAATRHCVNKALLARMKPSAYLINAARGGVLCEADLVEALRAGTIAGAGLDVFEQEPPQLDNPLFALDSVVVSPHNAAMSREGAMRMATDTAANVIAFVAGTVEPSHIVNRHAL